MRRQSVSAPALVLADRAAALREAFDRSFAAVRPPDPPPVEDLLAIRIGAEPYALRLSEIAGLHPDRRITPLPGGVPSLRGIAAFRGVIVPVYDLAAWLGHPQEEAVRWLALAASEPIAFAFAVVDGHLRVAHDAIVPNRAGERAHRHVREFARVAEQAVCPIVHLPSIIDAVRRLISPEPQSEGR
jgi:purine-binding chemotaxis protein CheW